MATDEEQKAELQSKFDAIKDTQLMADHLNAHAKVYLESQKGDIIGTAKGEAWGSMDNIVFELFAEKKGEGRTTDNIKKYLVELKALRAKAGSNTEDVTKALLEQKALYDIETISMQETLKEQTDLVSSLREKGVKRDIKAAVNEELAGATFKSHYSKSDIIMLGDVRLNKIMSNAKMEDEGIVHYNEDGTKRINKKMLPITTKEVVEAEYAEMFEAKTAGGGADDNNSSTTVSESGEVVMNMSKIKTKTEFNTVYWAKANELGKIRDNKEDFKEYEKAMSEYDYKALPLY